MANERKSQSVPISVFALGDLISLIFSLGPGALAWSTGLFYVRAVWQEPYFFAYALLSPFVLIFTFIAAILVLRLLCPRLKKGVYTPGFNAGMLAWFCNLALSRASSVSGLHFVINSFSLFKFLHWRALGARVPYAFNASIGVSFVDLPMITIGKGSTISEGVHIACHTFVGNKLLVAPVTIGENVFVGMNCIIGPRTTIKDGAWIGMSNLIGSDTIQENAKLLDFAWEHGNPSRRGEARVEKE